MVYHKQIVILRYCPYCYQNYSNITKIIHRQLVMVVRAGEMPFSTSFSPRSSDKNYSVGPSSSASSTSVRRCEPLVRRWKRLAIRSTATTESSNKRRIHRADREERGDRLDTTDRSRNHSTRAVRQEVRTWTLPTRHLPSINQRRHPSLRTRTLFRGE